MYISVLVFTCNVLFKRTLSVWLSSQRAPENVRADGVL